MKLLDEIMEKRRQKAEERKKKKLNDFAVKGAVERIQKRKQEQKKMLDEL